MSTAETDCEIPDAFRSLMRDDRAYSSSPLWRVRVSPGEATIGIRSQWKLAIIHFVLFASVGIGLFGAARWFNMPGDVARFSTWAAWFCWFMAAAFMGGMLVLRKYRNRQAWFLCRPLERTVSCPRLNKVFQVDEIHSLQLLTGKVTRPNPEGHAVMTVTQLNLIVKENGRLQRYPLIGDYGPGRLSQHAELLAEHSGIRLRKEKALSVADWT